MSKKDMMLVLLVVSIWGVNFLFMKIALTEVPPLILGVLRFLCVLFPAIFILKKPAVPWSLLALYGLTISFGQFSLMFLALSWQFPTGLAALIIQVQVFLTVLFSAVLFREPVFLHHVLAMLIAGLGLVLIGVGQYQGQLPLLAILPVLGAAISWACGNLVVKKIGKVDALSLVVWGSVSALAAFTLSAWWLYGVDGIWGHLQNLSIKGVAGVVFLAYVASLVGYTCWGMLLSHHPAGKVTPFALLVPVIALLVGYFLLNEQLGVWHWMGIVVVMLGLLLHVFGSWIKHRWQLYRTKL